MTKTRRADAQALLNAFLREDEHYLETSGSYGDAGLPALKRALGPRARRGARQPAEVLAGMQKRAHLCLGSSPEIP